MRDFESRSLVSEVPIMVRMCEIRKTENDQRMSFGVVGGRMNPVIPLNFAGIQLVLGELIPMPYNPWSPPRRRLLFLHCSCWDVLGVFTRDRCVKFVCEEGGSQHSEVTVFTAAVKPFHKNSIFFPHHLHPTGELSYQSLNESLNSPAMIPNMPNLKKGRRAFERWLAARDPPSQDSRTRASQPSSSSSRIRHPPPGTMADFTDPSPNDEPEMIWEGDAVGSEREMLQDMMEEFIDKGSSTSPLKDPEPGAAPPNPPDSTSRSSFFPSSILSFGQRGQQTSDNGSRISVQRPPPEQPFQQPGQDVGDGVDGQRNPTDSLSLVQLKRIVTDMPKATPPTYSYVYTDTDTAEMEGRGVVHV